MELGDTARERGLEQKVDQRVRDGRETFVTLLYGDYLLLV